MTLMLVAKVFVIVVCVVDALLLMCSVIELAVPMYR